MSEAHNAKMSHGRSAPKWMTLLVQRAGGSSFSLQLTAAAYDSEHERECERHTSQRMQNQYCHEFRKTSAAHQSSTLLSPSDQVHFWHVTILPCFPPSYYPCTFTVQLLPICLGPVHVTYLHLQLCSTSTTSRDLTSHWHVLVLYCSLKTSSMASTFTHPARYTIDCTSIDCIGFSSSLPPC